MSTSSFTGKATVTDAASVAAAHGSDAGADEDCSDAGADTGGSGAGADASPHSPERAAALTAVGDASGAIG